MEWTDVQTGNPAQTPRPSFPELRTVAGPPMSQEELSSRECDLLRSIEELYVVFGRYRLGPIDPDEVRPGGSDDRALRAAPLHQLPPTAFTEYHRRAVTTWGTVDDFKHFVPRLLEIVGHAPESGRLGEVDPFYVFTKLDCAGWTSWPAKERSAVNVYLNALWSVLLLRPVPEPTWQFSVHEWLHDLSSARYDFAPLFQQWEADLADLSRGPIPAFHLARLIKDEGQEFLRTRSLGRFWHGQARQVVEWLASGNIGQRLMDAFFAWHDMPGAEELSEAYELQQLCKRLVEDLRRNGEW